MRKIFTIIVLLVASVTLFAQDVIITKESQKIEAKITEISSNDVKYLDFNNQDGPIFVLHTDEISSIIFANGQVKVYDQSTNKSLVIKSDDENEYLYRIGNTYYYGGRAMRGDMYAQFLQSQCAEAYEQYKYGRNMSNVGWALLGVGLGLDLCFSWWFPYSWIPALACEIACIPTLIVGYNYMHWSTDVFNATYNKNQQTYWSITASENGLGLAFNF